MTKFKPHIFCLLLISSSCMHKNETKNDLTFGDFISLEKLDNVEMHNNSGTFNLTNKQIEKIKAELSEMIYAPNIAVKVGEINIELSIDGKVYNISSSTHGDYIEVPKDIVTKDKNSIGTSEWHYFKTGVVNFDNYKKETQ